MKPPLIERPAYVYVEIARIANYAAVDPAEAITAIRTAKRTQLKVVADLDPKTGSIVFYATGKVARA